jgi:hypothetical protein
MALLVFNITASPITITVTTPNVVVPASASAPSRGRAVNVTSECRPNLTVDPANGKTGGLTGANFTTLAGLVGLEFEWTSDPEYLTTGLTVSGPTPGVHTHADLPSAGEKLALAGTTGTPGSANKYVTDTDPRLTRVGAPELDRLDVAGGAAIAAAGGDIELVGRNLLQSQTFDGLQMTETPAFFQLYALKPGVSGITAEITVGVGLSVVITFTPGTGVLGIELPALGATDDLVATAINADLSPCNGYVRAVSGSAGSFTAAQGPTALFGGAGTYAKNKVMVGGLEALPANETGTTTTAKWSNTGITCTTQAVGAATDVAAVAVQSNGLWTQQICGVMV